MQITQKEIAVGIDVAKALPGILRFFQSIGKPNSGAQKKAAAIEVATSLAVATGGAAAANNPRYSEAIGGLIEAILPAVKNPTTAAIDPESITIPGTPESHA